jgi:hypothetical protein
VVGAQKIDYSRIMSLVLPKESAGATAKTADAGGLLTGS